MGFMSSIAAIDDTVPGATGAAGAKDKVAARRMGSTARGYPNPDRM
jgi:hypothetical protein